MHIANKQDQRSHPHSGKNTGISAARCRSETENVMLM
jgi:hypothetical protein